MSTEDDMVELLLEQARVAVRGVWIEAALRSRIERAERLQEESVSVESLRRLLESAP